MSISLKVVSIAAVFCASFRRSAMRRRSRVMRTRVSRSPVAARSAAARHGGGSGWRGLRRDHIRLGERPPGPVGGNARRIEPALGDQLADRRTGAFERLLPLTLPSPRTRARDSARVASAPSPRLRGEGLGR